MSTFSTMDLPRVLIVSCQVDKASNLAKGKTDRLGFIL